MEKNKSIREFLKKWSIAVKRTPQLKVSATKITKRDKIRYARDMRKWKGVGEQKQRDETEFIKRKRGII